MKYYICLEKNLPPFEYGELWESGSPIESLKQIPKSVYTDMKNMSVSRRLNIYGVRLGLKKKTFYYIKTGESSKSKGSLLAYDHYHPFEDGFEGWTNINKELYDHLEQFNCNGKKFKEYGLALEFEEYNNSRKKYWKEFDLSQIFTGKREDVSPIDFNKKFQVSKYKPEHFVNYNYIGKTCEKFKKAVEAAYRGTISYPEGARPEEDKIQFEINPQSEKNMFNNLTIKTNEATVNGAVIKTEAQVYDTISKVSEDLEQYKELSEKVKSEHVKSKIVKLEAELESLAKVLDSFGNRGGGV